MKVRIVISETKITKAGEWRLFQIRLPKDAKRIVAVASDLRMEGAFGMGGVVPGDSIWNIPHNPYAGKLMLQSMEKANIFFYDQVWCKEYNDGISDLDKVDAMDAFAMYVKSEPKKVDVPCSTTIINGLYRDALGVGLATDFTYTVKVLLWIEYETNKQKTEQ